MSSDAVVGLVGDISQSLPQAKPDGVDSGKLRMGKYDELYAVTAFPDMAVMALEGSYFTVNNAQTGIATAATPTAFSATNPFLVIYNTENPANALAKDIILDYVSLLATAAGTAGASVQIAVTLDQGNRYTSGGTDLTSLVVNPNPRFTNKSAAKVYAGNLTASAATTAVRAVVGNRYCKGAIPVAGDNYLMKFGGIDAPSFIGISTILMSLNNLPKVIIPPNWSAVVHLWLPSQSAASSYAPELGWVER